MTVFLGFMAVITLVMVLAPQSPTAKIIHRQLVEMPLARLADLERHHIIFFVIMVGFLIGGGEVFGLLGGEAVFAFALDFAIYLDAMAITFALAALSKVRRGVGWSTNVVRKMLRRPQVTRRKREAMGKPSDGKPANDDEDPAQLPLAA